MQCNVEAGKNPKVFVFDCRKMNRADFTAAKVDNITNEGAVFDRVFSVYRRFGLGFEEDREVGCFLRFGEDRGGSDYGDVQERLQLFGQ